MQMFEPQLTLTLEPDGDYTLDAVTITPNGSYSAGRAVRGAPSNVRVRPDVQPVLLHLRHRGGPALMVLRPVRHRVGNLKLGGTPGAFHGGVGKTHVLAFVMVDGKVVGSATIATPGAHEPGPGKPPVAVDSSDWYAWRNEMPPGPASFHVTGTVHAPTPGYRASLRPASPQGINPAELILDLVIEPLPGVWPQVVTPLSVRYDDPTPGVAYQGVLVREPDGDAIHVEVEAVF